MYIINDSSIMNYEMPRIEECYQREIVPSEEKERKSWLSLYVLLYDPLRRIYLRSDRLNIDNRREGGHIFSTDSNRTICSSII